MKILIAPDSFKGSMTAREAAEAMKQGILNAGIQADVAIIPMADGGEGTMTSLIEATKGSTKELIVKDPLGRNRRGTYGITGDGNTAVIELANASGLHTLEKEELDPAVATTYGTGQLIVDALDRGLRDFIICLGGSSTNDGGSGILTALGIRFLDHDGNELKLGGLALGSLDSINIDQVDKRIYESTFRVACDVENPLVGPKGASAVFAPQKGASDELVKKLDKALMVFADCIERQFGISVHEYPGAGAAGGTAGGLLALLNAELKPGIELVMEAVNFEKVLKEGRFDFLLSGEGKLDEQTASGKVVAGLAKAAKRNGVPVIAVAGSVEGDLHEMYEKGLTAAFSISRGPISLEEAMEKGKELTAKIVEQIFRLLTISG
ncbi:MAG TPA: glycerate kinase [Bacillales bacterium]|nr:glycerate kinase [Bacillales bacterium]